ncbi:rhomboid family intramembrane serine protease [Hymenobacter sp. BRD67]|uniref:rhomboid family intramembrane serine protease n=1 Tax=Hymenobacter sp. BRD67 TaxID=2675877 RepID=UPI0020B6BFD9|nr:rhomboid family intramembrane serine protease [Hymenobacter sp. BRD67]
MLNPILILIGLTVAISAYAWSNADLMRAWIMQPYLMARSSGQWYRLLTSGFLHADWPHLFFNMFAFYSFSPVVLAALAQRYGTGAGWACFCSCTWAALLCRMCPPTFSTATTATIAASGRRAG